jgi:hypothetical protein
MIPISSPNAGPPTMGTHLPKTYANPAITSTIPKPSPYFFIPYIGSPSADLFVLCHYNEYNESGARSEIIFTYPYAIISLYHGIE